MAQIIPFGDPVNDAERLAIAHLRDHLPNNYLVLHNFEIQRGDETFEVDIAVIAPHAVYLVDAKGTHGTIDVSGPKWYPAGRAAFTSPLLKLRSHARALKGIITDSHPTRRDLHGIYVDAVVLLTATDAILNDPSGRDSKDVMTLKKSAALFQDPARVPSNFGASIAPYQSIILKALQGVARRRTGPLCFRNWEVAERLGGTDVYTEYRAFNAVVGASSGRVRLRVYRADPYLPTDEREAQRKRIGNAYEALSRMRVHPNILGARDFFATDEEDGYVLVTDDLPGQALKMHLDKPELSLTLDQKRRMARDLLSALDHAHQYGVVHRNLTPGCILLGTDGTAKLTDFDFARAGTGRTHTIANQITDLLDEGYMAPELHGEAKAASPASDIFSAGLILYELFTGQRPFASASAVFDRSAVFSQKPSALRSELPADVDAWLQTLCTFDPEQRPSARWALERLESLFVVASKPAESAPAAPPAAEPPPVDYGKLEPGTQLTNKYVIEKRLGRAGSFGIVYKVVDTLGDVPRAIKLILRDRHSTLERLKKEYRTLLRTPEHPNVVRVYDADVLPGGGPPFIVFEFVNGLDVGEMIEQGLFSTEEALTLARQVAAGLVHLHRHGVYHCDIKPRNLLWTDIGAKIIDFNVSVLAASEEGHGGGSRRYLPPDLDLSTEPTPADLADRDCYALGLTLYEAVTGRYPWETSVPPPAEPAPDPRELAGLADLTPELVALLLKAIAPRRADRFMSAAELQAALAEVKHLRRPLPVTQDPSSSWNEAFCLGAGGTIPANTNPFVSYLLTLHSQSNQNNSGTRGLDALGRKIYVETALDRDLTAAVLGGELGLVLITGNAGDGKTAFLQKLEGLAQERGATVDTSATNGCRFSLDGRTYLSNYDGSQDADDIPNDDVLREFFAPYAGSDPGIWPAGEVRLIAINEGRLVDFLSAEGARFEALAQVVERGLASGVPENRVAVVNLNLRSVVADSPERPSILERLLQRMTHKKFWEPCQSCDLADRCYALHNARTFQDETAGPRVIERLKALYMVTHLRGRLHITIRDLRSAVAYMLTGTRTCAQIHALYDAGRRDEIIQSFYFNSWMGGDVETSDRLLTLLKDVDVGAATDPRLDRALDFVSPAEDRSLFGFEQRARCDRDILRRMFDDLPRDFTGRPGAFRGESHQRYLAMARRRAYFERRDTGWRMMLPYRTADRMLAIIEGREPLEQALREILDGINRGEGLLNPRVLAGSLGMQVREVENGTVRSYRLFPTDHFSLSVQDEAARARFVEHMPSALLLRYGGGPEGSAELTINLDVFEMLSRLNAGYRPSVEEEQGYCLNLAVFKNVLGSAPYQEVLLTTTGHDFYRIERHGDGRLEMNQLSMEVV